MFEIFLPGKVFNSLSSYEDPFTEIMMERWRVDYPRRRRKHVSIFHSKYSRIDRESERTIYITDRVSIVIEM